MEPALSNSCPDAQKGGVRIATPITSEFPDAALKLRLLSFA
jgi:hypothetical protein